MALRSFIKKLIQVGALFGAKAKKMAGISDSANAVSGTVIFAASNNSVTLASTPPSWIIPGKYFRITSGGGDNLHSLFKVGSISGNTIINDDTEVGVDAVVDFTGTSTVDGRLWQVIDDPDIALEDSASGATMWNVNNVSVTGFDDGSGVAVHVAPHYHGDEGDHHSCWDLIESGQSVRISSKKQMAVHGRVTVEGTIVIDGRLIIT